MNKLRVLIVEDEPALAELYKQKFEMEGFSVHVATDGIEAIDHAMHHLPDIILLDILLPKKDGFAVLKELKQETKTKHIPVVILSSLGQDFEIKKGKDEGAEDYLIKTEATPSDVVKKINAILKRS
ncbi:MAG: response regulator [Patescibacteria group bacterium]